MRTDRRTDARRDITKLIVAFCDFVNAPENMSRFSSQTDEGTNQDSIPGRYLPVKEVVRNVGSANRNMMSFLHPVIKCVTH
jgi:hypothetical protein